MSTRYIYIPKEREILRELPTLRIVQSCQVDTDHRITECVDIHTMGLSIQYASVYLSRWIAL